MMPGTCIYEGLAGLHTVRQMMIPAVYGYMYLCTRRWRSVRRTRREGRSVGLTSICLETLDGLPMHAGSRIQRLVLPSKEVPFTFTINEELRGAGP